MVKVNLQTVTNNEELYSLILEHLQNKHTLIPLYEEIREHVESLLKNIQYEYIENPKTFQNSFSDEEVLRIIERYNSELSKDNTEAVCIFSDYANLSSEETLLAFLYSIVFKKKFIYLQDWDELEQRITSESTNSYFIVLPYSQLDFSFSYRVEYSKKFIGYLPYSNKHTIITYLLKRLSFLAERSSTSNFLLLNRIQSKNDEPVRHSFEGVQTFYFPKGQCVLENLEGLLTSPSDLIELNYIAHSRECSLVMDDFLFCGYYDTLKYNLSDQHHFLPSCFYDGNLCYTSNRKRLSAKTLRAKILFLNGCNIGDMDKSCIPYSYTVISHLIDGDSVSITTSPSIKIGDVVENILAHNLLKYGYSEGEKLYFLNRFLLNTGLENNLYYQIGDPSISYGVREKVCTYVEMVEQSEIDIILNGIYGETYCEVRIMNHKTDQKLYVKDYILELDNGGSDKKTTLYYHKTDLIGDMLIFIFFTKEPIEAKSLRVTISSEDPIVLKMQRINQFNHNLEFIKEYSNLQSNVKGRLVDLQNQVINLNQSRKSYKYILNNQSKLISSIHNLEDRYKQMSKELFSNMAAYTQKHSNSFYEKISEKRINADVIKFNDLCKECGKPTGEFSYSIFTYIGYIQRKCYKCFHCGGISDVADNLLEFKGKINIRFTSEGLINTTIYEIRNLSEHSVVLCTSAISIDSKNIEIVVETEEIILLPNKSFEFKISIKPNSSLEKGYYLFSFYFMADTRFYYLSKIIGYVNCTDSKII